MPIVQFISCIPARRTRGDSRKPAAPRPKSLRVEFLEERRVLHHGDEPLVWAGEPEFDPGTLAGPIATGAPAMGLPQINYSVRVDGLPLLNSRPGAMGAVYLDFDGDPTISPGGTSSTPYSEDGDGTTFNTAEQASIVEIWRRLSRWLAPFDLDVTTVQPNMSAVPTAWHVITNSNLNAGGWGYVGAFGATIPRAWTAASAARSVTASVTAHETGHVLALQHQSLFDSLANKTAEYRSAVNTSHAIVMGSGGTIAKWFFGYSSNGATILQDDVATMITEILSVKPAGYVGDGFAPDDFGNTIAFASALPTIGNAQATSGIIERMNDVDMFSFASTGGNYSIAAVRDMPSGVDLKLSVYDSSGNLLAAEDGDPLSFTSRFNNDQYVTLDLPAGTYYVGLQSHGNYGDLGQYLVSVNPLPSGWQSQTVGVNVNAGYSAYDSVTDTFTVAGGGSDLNSSAGGAQFAWQTLTGDGSIVARVTSIENTNSLAKAGVMIRDTLDSAARFVAMTQTYGTGPELLWRTTTAGTVSTNYINSATTFVAKWLKIVRAGSTFTSFTSDDGSSWTQWGSALSVTMGATAYIGLATSSATSNQTLNIAQLTGVALTGNLNAGPTLNALAAPTGLAVLSTTATSVNLTWLGVAGATGYTVERSRDGINYATTGTTIAAVTSFNNSSGLYDGERFFYRVRANDATGVSTPSAPVVATTRPGSVTLSMISASTSQIVVTWTDADGETGYRLERSPDGSTGWTTIATTATNITGYVNSGLTANTKYYYRVTTLDAVGDSATSSTVAGSTRLTALSGLLFTDVGTNHLSFTWSAHPDANSYRIDRSTDNVNFTTLTTISGVTSYTDTTVSPLGDYYYRVMGVNSTTGSVGMIPNSLYAATLSTTPPPSPWRFQDVGTLPGSGAGSYNSGTGTHTIITSGSAFGSTSDRGGLIWQPIVGNTTIVARVATIGSNLTGATNAAGVMIREHLGTGAKFVMARRANGSLAAMESRSTENGSATVGSTVSAGTNYYVRITRNGDLFTSEGSSNGTTWTTLGTTTIVMNSVVYVGLVLESDSASYLTSATFTNVSVTGTPLSTSPVNIGDEVRANTTTAAAQTRPAAAADANGNYVVSWTSAGQDTSGTGIYAKMYNATGAATTAEFLVNTGGQVGDQLAQAIARDAAGNYIVTWQDNTVRDGSGTGIYAQRYNTSGATVGTQTSSIPSTTTGDQTAPSVAMAPSGNYVIAWTHANDGSGQGIRLRRYSSTGTAQGTDVLINATTTGNQYGGKVAMNAAGDYVVVWASTDQDGSGDGVYARRFNSSGTNLVSEFLVNSTTADEQTTPAVASASDGKFMVAWASRLQDGSGYGIVARLFSAFGAPLTAEIPVNQLTSGDQTRPSISVDNFGNYFITWQSVDQDGSGTGVYGRRFDAAGTALGNEFLINRFVTGDQANPTVVVTPLGTALVAWQSANQDGSSDGVYWQRFANNETPTTGGLGNLVLQEDAPPQVVDLFAAFADTTDLDGVLSYSISSNTNPSLFSTAAINGTAGTLTLTPAANLFGAATIVVRATDTGGLWVESTFNVTVATVADTPSVTGAATQPNVQTTSGLVLSRNSADGAEVTHYKITGIAGGTLFHTDGTTVINNNTFITIAAGSSGLKFTPSAATNGSFIAQASLSASDAGLGGSAVTATIVVDGALDVTGLTATTTGVIVDFDRTLDVSVLNLYDMGGPTGAADATLHGPTGEVRGSILIDPTLKRLRFIASGGMIPPGPYSLSLHSSTSGFKDSVGYLLDGNHDGLTGDDYYGNFTIPAPELNARTVAVPDFTRGFGQPVNLPANTTDGLPITISNAQGVSAVNFTLTYDPQLLSITGATLGAGLTGALSLNLATPGLAIVSITSASELSATAGAATLVKFAALVPSAAPYATKHVLDITGLHILDSATTPAELPAIDDDGIHVAAYFGDANGSQSYNSPDASIAQQIIVGTTTGLNAYRLADPHLLVDVTSNGQVQSSDVTLIQRAIVGTATAEIPPFPGLSPIIAGGPDPIVSIPQNLVATAGQSVAVPVELEVTEPTGITLGGADLVIAYDASQLAFDTVATGAMLVGFGVSVSETTPGLVRLTLAGSTPLGLPYEAAGTLVVLNFTVLDGAAGPSVINLMASSGLRTALYDPAGNPLTLSPAPTDRLDDAVDGLVTILASEQISAQAHSELVESAFQNTDDFTAEIS